MKSVATKLNEKRSKSKSPYKKSVDLLLSLKKDDRVSATNIRSDKSERCGCTNETPMSGKNKSVKRRNVAHSPTADRNNNKRNNNNNNSNSNNNSKKIKDCDRLPKTPLERKVQLIRSATKVLLDSSSEGEKNDESDESDDDDDEDGEGGDDDQDDVAVVVPKGKHQLLEERLAKRKSLERMINGVSKRPNCTSAVREGGESKVVVVKAGEVDKGARGGKKGKHERTYTHPIGRERNEEMDLLHQNMMKMKKVAGQVMKVRVFLCARNYFNSFKNFVCSR